MTTMPSTATTAFGFPLPQVDSHLAALRQICVDRKVDYRVKPVKGEHSDLLLLSTCNHLRGRDRVTEGFTPAARIHTFGGKFWVAVSPTDSLQVLASGRNQRDVIRKVIAEIWN